MGNPIRRVAAALAVVTVVFAAPEAANAALSSHETPHAVPGRALVRFRPGTAPSSQRLAHARAGTNVIAHLTAIGYDVVEASAPVAQILSSYAHDSSVAIAEPDYAGRIASAANDACLSACTGTPGQWQFAMNNAAFGWSAFRANGPRVEIAVLDTHIDTTHPDFVNADGSSQFDLPNAHNWVAPSRWTGSAAYHGTFVAGLAAAAVNDKDAVGVGNVARILPLTVVDGSGNTDAATLADAITYASQHGARIINLSLGILGDSNAVHDAIKLASKTALVVAAAGNNTANAAFYPGSYPEVMSVSGTDQFDGRASCSNYNGNVSVSAPADRLIGDAPMPSERTQAPCGTSAAAPQVSGLGALLLSQDPSLTPAAVRATIERTSDDLGAPGRDDSFGAGRINVERALHETGPRITQARTTVPAPGGTATITAKAIGTKPIERAQLVFDSPSAPPIEMHANFGATTVDLTATIPSGAQQGAHPLWIRAYDGTEWGATAVTVVAIDGRAPTIGSAQATNAVRAAGQPASVTFTATDDHSTLLSYGIEFRSTATNQIVARVTRMNVVAGAQRFDWAPELTLPGGHYNVKIGVVDQAGNVASTEIGTVIA